MAWKVHAEVCVVSGSEGELLQATGIGNLGGSCAVGAVKTHTLAYNSNAC